MKPRVALAGVALLLCAAPLQSQEPPDTTKFAATPALIAEELPAIYETLVAYYCAEDIERGIVLLNPQVYPRGYHHEPLQDAPRHAETLRQHLIEETCAEHFEEADPRPDLPYRILALTPPVINDGGVSVEIVVTGIYDPGPRGMWMSNTAYRLARFADGWRVVKVKPRWIT